MVEKKFFLPSEKKRKRIIKAQVKTSPFYGKKPDEKNVIELLSNGIINLDKPCGPTSHQVDSWVRGILEVERVGHSGTLDPRVTGVLPIAIGDATKGLQALLPAGKEYVCVMKIHKDVDKKKVKDACEGFVGKVTQLPPVRSAVKRAKRKREIYYVDVMEIRGRDVLFRVGCESGTYIRTLCVDIGRKLRTRAHLVELRRTKVGKLNEGDSVILQELKDAYVFWKEEKDEKFIRSIISPVEKAFEHLPKIVIRDSAVDALCHGASLAMPGVVEIDSGIVTGDDVGVMTLKGEVVALAKTLIKTEDVLNKDSGVCAVLGRVLMKKGTYPSIWKKS